MQTMNISLPDPLKEFVDHQIAGGRYSSVSEYIRELIRDDEKRKAEQRLEALLASLNVKPPPPGLKAKVPLLVMFDEGREPEFVKTKPDGPF